MAYCRPPASPYWQLRQGDPNGGVNCSAYQAAAGEYFDSCGLHRPTGAQVRAWSSEPIPDPDSPGLNLMQLGDVLLRHYGTSLDIHLGLAWGDVVDASAAGHGIILSIGYDPIRLSKYRGSLLFRGGHALFIAPLLYTYDSLADGRVLNSAGARAFTGPATYPSELLKTAAGQLPTKIDQWGHVLARAGYGKAWCGILPTRHPLGTTPVPVPPGVVTSGPQFSGGDVAIARGGLARIDSGYVVQLAKGQPLFNQAGSSSVRTRMSTSARVPYVGMPTGGGWLAVEVSTGAYSDGKQRPTILYVPRAVGEPVPA